MTILTAHNSMVDFTNDTMIRENKWHTTLLTLNIMQQIATRLQLDLSDPDIAYRVYDICSHLESWPEDQGFGSSDSYGEHQQALREFGQKVTCGNCKRSWDESRDPAPSALCHWCHGRGSSDFEMRS